MLKKVLIGGILVVLVLGIGLFFWARAVLGNGCRPDARWPHS